MGLASSHIYDIPLAPRFHLPQFGLLSDPHYRDALLFTSEVVSSASHILILCFVVLY